MRRSLFLPLLALSLSPAGAQGTDPATEGRMQAEDRWITLGTRGGPIASATRSQPANLLMHGRRAFLVDAGDGTAGQLAKAGVPANRLEAIFISHLHFDHTAGLAGILGLRWQTNAPNRLTVYGPPGTAELVEGLLASMVPGTTAGYGVPGAPQRNARDQVEVIELRDRATVQLDGMAVRARSNTHYSFVPGSDLAARFQSLSFRFDLPRRSIVYSGDTGPSPAVEELARGADLLVAEMMDVEDTIAKVRLNSPNLDPRVAAGMETHLRTHHLLPGDVGALAARAGVGAVVITHFVGEETGSPAHLGYLREIAERYEGPVVIAADLEAF